MPGLPLLVGRDHERERAELVLEPGSPAPFVLLEGEPGIGKTRLTREVVQVAGERDRAVVFGAAEDGDGAALPFALWRGPLRQLDHRLPPSEAGVPVDERRWEVWELLDSALEAAGRPVVVLEDLHWADDDSLWVLRQLVGTIGRTPVLATARPIGPSTPRRWLDIRRDATVIALEPITEADVAALLRDEGRDPEDAARIHERAGGNPLLVHELLTGGATGRGSTVLADHLRRLLDDLGPDVAATVHLLSLGGSTTPVAVIAEARGVPANQVVAEIARAVQADILRTNDEQVVFRHALLNETLVEHLDPAERAAMHERLADAWAAQGHDLTARLAESRHWLSIGTGNGLAARIEDALGLARDATVAGRAAEAAGLCDRAAAVADELLPGDIDLRARVLVEAAEARWELDDFERATADGERAVALAEEGASVGTRAHAAVVALRHHNPFEPDPVAAERLERLTDELEAATGDDRPDAALDPLLVEVLGRRSMLEISLLDAETSSRDLGDRALELARAFGDPELVIGALRDRYFAPATPADLDARGAAAQEVLTLARAAGRPDLALMGHEWLFEHHLTSGDLRSAEAALDQLAVLARVMSSPNWRYTELVRRPVVLLLSGRFDEALAVIDEARRVADSFAAYEERAGIQIGQLVSLWLVSGIGDARLESLYESVFPAPDPPVAFLRVQRAASELYFGRTEAAAQHIEPWLARPHAALAGPEGFGTVTRLAEVVWRAGLPGARAVREVLVPFSGRTVSGVGASLPVDAHLGWLALVDGDATTAVVDATAALATARALPSPPLEAHALLLLSSAQAMVGDDVAARSARDAADAIAERLGMTFPNLPWLDHRMAGAGSSGGCAPSSTPAVTLAPAAGREATLSRDGAVWAVRSPHGDCTVPDSVGMGQLAQLLARPGVELTAAELAGANAADAPPVAGDLGAALDARAKREYRRRITELQAEIDEADAYNDPARSERAQAELDLLLQELRRSVGLGGRDRPQGSGNERARVNVTRNLRRAIKSIDAELPALGAHLSVSVRTGHRCSYSPEPSSALEWSVPSTNS